MFMHTLKCLVLVALKCPDLHRHKLDNKGEDGLQDKRSPRGSEVSHWSQMALRTRQKALKKKDKRHYLEGPN